MNLITKNYLYNFSYQIFTILIPLITTPYLARVLGASNLGIYSYVYSITNFISSFTLLGIYNYGNRQIAYERDNKTLMSQTFWEIMLIRFIISIVGSLIYFFVAFELKEYTKYFSLFFFWILANYLDCTWLYVGVENMKPAVAKNFFARIVGVICIFLFVKERDDVGLYLFILAISMLIANLLAYAELKKYITKAKIEIGNLLKHLRVSVALFIPSMAILIYLQADKIMIEWITGETAQVSYYDNAEKIITIPLTIITVLSTVMMPRIANEFKKRNYNKIQDLIVSSIETSLYLSFPMMFGISIIAENMIPWYLGDEYKPVIVAIYLLSPIIVLNAIESVSGKQYFTATNRPKILVVAYGFTATFNILMNIILIPILGFYGATISTLFSSFLTVCIQFYFMTKEVCLRGLFLHVFKYFFMSFLMFGVTLLSTITMEPSALTTLIQITLGVLIYSSISFIIKDKVFLRIIKTRSII